MSALEGPILRNEIRCRRCHEKIESRYQHDFKFCRCRAVAVDGGKDYLKRCGEPNDWEELSVTTGDDP